MLPRLDFTAFSEEDLCGEWPEGAPDDPLIILLAHHEEMGRIKVCHAPYLADRLESLAEHMMKSERMSWVLMTQEFARGLRSAACYNQDVVFS